MNDRMIRNLIVIFLFVNTNILMITICQFFIFLWFSSNLNEYLSFHLLTFAGESSYHTQTNLVAEENMI
ncbi:hypothetical protein EUGRSUZ_I02043 [Eucalyptus grandis]|uniref:Uncharacterized protein n=2 Tax=Eucalyptus grandis TaxID=71139 RepID=A0A059AQQ2_EUCGR|nr:hypothetical protein EUGRSUZ_I02043 [Eucalyptus grandis]